MATIRPDQVPRLEQNAAYLKQHPEMIIHLTGHTDQRGTESYNKTLGMQRAQAIREWLVKNGIEAKRVETESRGKDDPANEGTTERAMAENRRVIFKPIKPAETEPAQ